MPCGRFAAVALLLLAASLPAGAAEDEKQDAPPTSAVGMAASIDQIILPGNELVAKPIESREVPMVVRVVASYPHGTDFRYDLEYYGLEVGTYDLGDYLQRKDGTPVEGLPKLPVEIVSQLPPGQILPADPAAQPAPRLGGYRIWLILGMLVWLAGLGAILFARRRAQRAQHQPVARPLTLAERLRPLIDAAVAGRMSPEETAEIERLLHSYWRRKLKLETEDPLAAVAALRQHEQAGALLRQVEAWLHAPQGAGEVDVAALLAPYRDLPAEEVDESKAGIAHAGAGGRA